MALTIEPLSTVFWELRLRAWLAHAASRARAEENRPHWVSAVLICLIVLELFRAILPLTRPLAARPTAALTLAARPAQRTRVDGDLIVAAHLFGIAAAHGDLNPADAIPTTAALKLFGTIVSPDPQRGLAIVEANGQQKLYRVGEDVGGASLHSVYLTRVLLNRDGQLETLSLPRFDTLEKPLVATPMPAMMLAGPQEGFGEHHVAEILRTEPAVEGDSDKLLGFRIAPLPPAMRFIRAGLKPADLVIAVNGTPLADQDRERSQKVLDSALATSSVTLTVMRNGQPVDVAVSAAR